MDSLTNQIKFQMENARSFFKVENDLKKDKEQKLGEQQATQIFRYISENPHFWKNRSDGSLYMLLPVLQQCNNTCSDILQKYKLLHNKMYNYDVCIDHSVTEMR